jgi:hypothetical protein
MQETDKEHKKQQERKEINSKVSATVPIRIAIQWKNICRWSSLRYNISQNERDFAWGAISAISWPIWGHCGILLPSFCFDALDKGCSNSVSKNHVNFRSKNEPKTVPLYLSWQSFPSCSVDETFPFFKACNRGTSRLGEAWPRPRLAQQVLDNDKARLAETRNCTILLWKFQQGWTWSSSALLKFWTLAKQTYSVVADIALRLGPNKTKLKAGFNASLEPQCHETALRGRLGDTSRM